MGAMTRMITVVETSALLERSEISKLPELHGNIRACSNKKSCVFVRLNLVLEYLT